MVCRLISIFSCAVLLTMSSSSGVLISSASAQSIPLPPPLQACFDRDHGTPVELIPESSIESCYPLAFQFVRSRGWLGSAIFWSYVGKQGAMQWLEYTSEFRLPGPIECRMVSDGFGYSFRGDIERVRSWTFSPAGLARISDPLDRAKHLTDAYERTTVPCSIGQPQASQVQVEQYLQRIAEGPRVFQCKPWGRGACDDRRPRTGTFTSIPNPLPLGNLRSARAQSYGLTLKMFQ